MVHVDPMDFTQTGADMQDLWDNAGAPEAAPKRVWVQRRPGCRRRSAR